MARGRKPDGPALQTAKGSPGKRSFTRTMSKRITRLAANDPANPPPFLAKGKGENGLGDALKIWRELVPQLQRRNLLDRIDRYGFARWCVYQAEWIEATRTIRREGITRTVTTVSGDEMPRRHPAAAHRDRVELAMTKLEASYGLTPADRYKVMRDQALAPIGGLFGQEGSEPDAMGDGPVSRNDPVGFLSDHAATPPGTRPN